MICWWFDVYPSKYHGGWCYIGRLLNQCWEQVVVGTRPFCRNTWMKTACIMMIVGFLFQRSPYITIYRWFSQQLMIEYYRWCSSIFPAIETSNFTGWHLSLSPNSFPLWSSSCRTSRQSWGSSVCHRSDSRFVEGKTYLQCGPPRDVSWFRFAPVTIVISTINHSYWSYKPT